MKLNKLFKICLVPVCSLALGAVSIMQQPVQARGRRARVSRPRKQPKKQQFAISVHVRTRAQARYNRALSRRAGAFERQRRAYYHPNITYDTRDLGGIKTKNGKYQIRPHMIYRSANLHFLNAKGARELKRLNIYHDIDLRAYGGPNNSIRKKPQPGEFHLMKDRYHIDMVYHNYPVESSRQEAYTWPIRKRVGETYRFGYWYTTSHNAKRAYRNSLRRLMHIPMDDPGEATLVNCTQGRDRTGTFAAIFEAALGVSKHTIYNDFLLTNKYKYQTNYLDQISRINKFYKTLDKSYGNMWNYIRKGLGMSNHDIRVLRYEYLEPVRKSRRK